MPALVNELVSCLMKPWFDLIAFVLCTVGHVALMVAILNRLQSRRVSRSGLKLLQVTHYALLLAFPLALAPTVWSALFSTSNQIFLWQLPDLVRGYACGCLAIAAIVPVIGLIRTGGPAPRALLATRSEVCVLDAPAHVPKSLAARIPGNQIRQVEFNEKHLEIPRLPPAWDGLTILHLSDLHFTGNPEREFFERVLQRAVAARPDLIAFTGDLLDRQELREWLQVTLGQLHAPLGCHYVLGNHDWFLGGSDETRQALSKLGWKDATTGCVIEHLGQSLTIRGTETPWMGELPKFQDTVPNSAEFRLLLSHSPDAIGWARNAHVDLMLAGHTHGGQIRVPGLGPIYSPSLHGGRYASGLFWEQPTVLHVSRGLSGETPLRLNCRPEVTRLVLHAPAKVSTRSLPSEQHARVLSGTP